MTAQLTFRTLIGAALALLLTTTAQADDDQRQARILYQKGNAAFKKGDSILARDYYRKSLALHESFDTICNLGRAQAKDKLYVEAYESLLWCSHLYPEDDELAEARIKFIRLRDEVRTELSPLDQKEVDDQVAEELERRRHEEAEAGIETQNETESVPMTAPERNTVQKRSRAAAPVSLTIGGLGVVGLGVGTGFLIDGISKDEDAKDLSAELEGVDCSVGADERCSQLVDLAEKKDRSMNIATASLIAGGALAVGATLAYLLWPKTRTVTVGGVELHQPLPAVDFDRRTGSWQAGFSAKF